ncbi:hypothetical protein V8C43DRAFT_294109 [Trichoderma afarasin]
MHEMSISFFLPLQLVIHGLLTAELDKLWRCRHFGHWTPTTKQQNSRYGGLLGTFSGVACHLQAPPSLLPC